MELNIICRDCKYWTPVETRNVHKKRNPDPAKSTEMIEEVVLELSGHCDYYKNTKLPDKKWTMCPGAKRGIHKDHLEYLNKKGEGVESTTKKELKTA